MKKYDIINTLTTGYYCGYISLIFVRTKLNISSIGNVVTLLRGSLKLGFTLLVNINDA